MTNKILVLDPEPITLLDNDDNTMATITSTQSRRSSIANSNFYFEKVFVSDCTIVSGEEHTPKFAVWKVTVVMHPLNSTHTGSFHIRTYKRYSDFVKFRECLLDRIREERPQSVKEIPALPPTVKWYYYGWKYDEVNLDKNWLAKRRKGLELFINQVLLNSHVMEIAKDLVIQFLRTGNSR
ncbi:Endosomal/vacuolar adapter protein YPT35 [Nakaseomyces bracarensis]|uniref:Endosomal/vacuolar adapter protein YPT35 n=1 Tax=Nakaseomyces bracarensis TaxID=273131 RepID=A0ABR4NUN9_9SACH